MPADDACLSQIITLTVTVSILFMTPTTVYVVADTSDWHQKPCGAEGAAALAEYLSGGATLTSLDLGYNKQLGSAGGTAIAAALRVNTALQTLNLQWTGLDAEAGKALAEALKVNTTLKKLNLKSNFSMGDAAKQALRDAVAGRDGFELKM